MLMLFSVVRLKPQKCSVSVGIKKFQRVQKVKKGIIKKETSVEMTLGDPSVVWVLCSYFLSQFKFQQSKSSVELLL